MRHLINIVESSYSDSFHAASPEKLRAYASLVEGENEDDSADDFDWHYDPAYPLSKLVSNMPGGLKGWKQWWKAELKMDQDDELGRDWNVLDKETIEEPVVYGEYPDGSTRIWDGWHRTAGSIVSDKTTIPAVVGRPSK